MKVTAHVATEGKVDMGAGWAFLTSIPAAAQKGEAGARLAIADRDQPIVHIYDARSGSDQPVASVKVLGCLCGTHAGCHDASCAGMLSSVPHVFQICLCQTLVRSLQCVLGSVECQQHFPLTRT